jgi:hypothetical protein
MNCQEFLDELNKSDRGSGVLRHAVEGLSAELHRVVTEPLPLKGMRFEHPVSIRYVVFKHFVDFSEWRCRGALRIEFCVFEAGLRLADTEVDGPCSLQGSTFHDARKCWFDFRRLRIRGLLDCTLVTAHAALVFESSLVEGDVWFDGAILNSALKLLDDEQLKAVQATWVTEEEKVATKVLGLTQ